MAHSELPCLGSLIGKEPFSETRSAVTNSRTDWSIRVSRASLLVPSFMSLESQADYSQDQLHSSRTPTDSMHQHGPESFGVGHLKPPAANRAEHYCQTLTEIAKPSLPSYHSIDHFFFFVSPWPSNCQEWCRYPAGALSGVVQKLAYWVLGSVFPRVRH